jgi:hypothetical protein
MPAITIEVDSARVQSLLKRLAASHGAPAIARGKRGIDKTSSKFLAMLPILLKPLISSLSLASAALRATENVLSR